MPESVLLWQLEPPSLLRRLEGHEDTVNAVAISPDGRIVVSGADDGTVRVWETETVVSRQDVQREVLGLPDGRQDAARVLRGNGASVRGVALDADGMRILAGFADGSVRLWNGRDGELLCTLVGHDAGVTAVALAAQAERALSGASDGSLVAWDLATGQPLARLDGHSDAVRALTLSADGREAASASSDRTLKLWQLEGRKGASAPPVHAGAVTALAFSADGRLCASGGTDGSLTVHDVSSGGVLRRIDAHSGPVRTLAFTPDGACVLSGGIDDRYWLWISRPARVRGYRSTTSHRSTTRPTAPRHVTS